MLIRARTECGNAVVRPPPRYRATSIARRLDFAMVGRDRGRDPLPGRTQADSMVHLSVAIGRFFEALLWALARGVGVMAGWAILAALALAVVALAVRAVWRRR